MPLRFPIDQVNRYVLHKQHLTPGSQARDAVSVVRDVGPIRATPAASLYISLWARVKGFARQQLDTALYQERTFVRVPCMHARLYLVPSEDLSAYYQTLKPLLLLGLHDLDDLVGDSYSKSEGNHPLRSSELAQRVLEVMSTRGPSTLVELAELLPELNTRIHYDPDNPELGHSRLATRLIPAMCAEGTLIRAQTRGRWRSDLYSYTTLHSWLPGIDLESMSPRDALQRVVLRYVQAFGPVTIGDILHWLGRYARRRIAAALMSLGDRLTRIQIVGSRGDYFMVKEQIPELLDYSLKERNVCLLPPRDSYAMAYSAAVRFMAEPYIERVFDRVGESTGTVWVDGYIVGTWWARMREERIVVRFFESIDPQALALAGEEARRLAEFLDFPSLDIDIGTYPEQDLDEEERAIMVLVHGDPRRRSV